MSPLEFLLFLTFLIYTYFFKCTLFLTYLILVGLYFLFCVIIGSSSIDGQSLKKQKLMTATFQNPDEGCAHLVYEFDVTESLSHAAKLSKENGIPVTITHIALRALALGINKAEDIQKMIKWGNYYRDEDVSLTTLVNVDKGKDLVPIHITNPTKEGVVQIARKMNKMVEKARLKQDEVQKKRYLLLPYLPTFIIRPATYFASYLTNKLNVSLSCVGFKRKSFGNAIVSNVGVFGMKRGFAPLIQQSGCQILIAMGKQKKELQ